MCQTFRGMATAEKKNRGRETVLSEVRKKQEEIRSVEKRIETVHLKGFTTLEA